MEAALVPVMPAAEARERLVAFVEDVVDELAHVRQRENALVYVRGLIEYGGRKSLQPTLFRLEQTPARYESMQQFLADSPWDPALLVRACAERVAAKIGNCQLTVSLHAVGERGTLPLGWRLYLPEEWCDDLERRQKAKIPESVVFETKPRLAAGLCEQAAGWELPAAPILADSAYGDDTAFRSDLHALGLEFVLAVRAETSVYGPETTFAVPQRNGTTGRPPTVARPHR